ncbi:hypothetical protein AYO44_07990 [Planctomycetaceae bacterium SCGC AG-212-F19]|nr:hypothetical protein AYO44_07990 [Planctomycetaceae bacterium SCGC AG-212-F19]
MRSCMGTKRRIALNVIYNWAGMAVGLMTGFLTVRLLVEQLGEHGYGLWIQIASLSGYFGLLDLGIRGSVGRNMAFCRARGDGPGVNALFSTALAIFTVPALLALLGTAGVLLVFFHLFDVPPSQEPAVRVALLLMGVNLALSILLSLFDASLWSMQRFDVLNAIDIPVALLRLGLTLALVEGAHGLTTLAWITLASTLLAGVGKAWLSFRLDPGLRLARHAISRDAARTLLHFGAWSWVGTVARIVTEQCGPNLIGSLMGLAAAPPFSIAAQLVGRAGKLLVAASGVLVPVATVLHAADRHAEQQRLVRDGGKFCLALGLYFVALFILLGEPLLHLWLGRPMDHAFTMLVILAIGESLPLGQLVSSAIILGMGRHRMLACVGLIETVVVVGLGWWLLSAYGVIGMAVALAVPGFFCRGLFPMLAISRVVALPVGVYVRDAIAPAVLAAVLPSGGLALLVHQRPVVGWFDLIAYTACFTAAYGASALLFVVPHSMRVRGWALLRPPILAAPLDVGTAVPADALLRSASPAGPTSSGL